MERVCSGSKATEKNPSGPKGLEGLRYPQKCIPAGRATLSREIAQTSPRVRRDLRIKHRLAPIPHAATNREVARICIRTRKTRVNHHQRKKRPGGWPSPLANRRSKIRPWIGEVQVAFTPICENWTREPVCAGLDHEWLTWGPTLVSSSCHRCAIADAGRDWRRGLDAALSTHWHEDVLHRAFPFFTTVSKRCGRKFFDREVSGRENKGMTPALSPRSTGPVLRRW